MWQSECTVNACFLTVLRLVGYVTSWRRNTWRGQSASQWVPRTGCVLTDRYMTHLASVVDNLWPWRIIFRVVSKKCFIRIFRIFFLSLDILVRFCFPLLSFKFRLEGSYLAADSCLECQESLCSYGVRIFISGNTEILRSISPMQVPVIASIVVTLFAMGRFGRFFCLHHGILFIFRKLINFSNI
jgi:hypothetical protein